MKLIDRPTYIDRILSIKNTPDIKIITGIRRAGKSKLMQAFIKHVSETEPLANIIYVDFTRLSAEPLKEYHALNDYIEQHTKIGYVNYVFIDEVQMCPNFEICINSLHASENYDIYLSGSNAFMLSNDLATLFTGRHIEIHVYPFSFREYCDYFQETTDLQVLLDRYCVEGGFAGSYIYSNAQDKETYIREVYNTIITRDLTEKYNIGAPLTLAHLSEYLMDNISNITSANNVANTLVANKISTSHVTSARYITYLCNAFVFYQAGRYDIKGKKYLESLNKYYLVDPGIRFAVLGRRNMDWGRIYENIIYIELLRRGYRVYIGKLYQKEVDFVAMKGDEKIYIQVCDDLSKDETFKREIDPLLKITDAYPKMILARTRHTTYDYQGIKIHDLSQWLYAI